MRGCGEEGSSSTSSMVLSVSYISSSSTSHYVTSYCSTSLKPVKVMLLAYIFISNSSFITDYAWKRDKIYFVIRM